MNKKYNVYGIGNALVDLEFRIDNTFLKEHEIKKSLMTLVDEQTQNKLMNAIDHKETTRKPGGSAANSMMAVSQFGGKTFYSCKVANDEFGDFYLKDLKEAGISTNFSMQEREPGITGKCLVMITEDAERTLNTFLGITSTISVKEVDTQAIKDSEYVYLEGYLATSENGTDAMKLVKSTAEECGVKTALTLSDPSVVHAFRKQFKEVIGTSVDLLFCNEEEAKAYTGMETLAEAREVLKNVAKRFVITLGKNGAMIFDGDTFIDIEPYNVKAIDSNGAGDVFSGAFMYGITHGLGYAASGKLASLAGSKIVAQYGPRLEWHQAQEVLHQLK